MSRVLRVTTSGVTTSMGKGSVNERHLRDCYENAGYRVYRPATVRFGENDMWGLFDLACLTPEHWRPVDCGIHLVQCKTNRARGITEWFENARVFNSVPGVTVAYAVRHDRKGWRVAFPDGTTATGYSWLYDGRQSDDCIGEGLTNYLRGNQE